jgi:hypothetical protein
VSGHHALQSDSALPSKVARYDPYSVSWGVGDSPVDFATTDCRMYVTLAPPQLSTSHTQYRPYESIFDISCGAAHGETSAAGARSKIWAKFVSREVDRKPVDGFNQPDEARLYYWLTTSPGHSVPELIRTANGSCEAWAYASRACLRAQSDNSGAVWRLEHKMGQLAYGLAVKNWGWAGGPNGLLYGVDFYSLPGIPGQGNNPTPAGKVFNIHYVVVVDGHVYDTSYGTGGPGAFPTFPIAGGAESPAHENASIDGFVYRSGGTVYANLNNSSVSEVLYVAVEN